MNIHDHYKGRAVITRAGVRRRRLAADFPGWGDPDYTRFLLDIPPDVRGTVASVESHGIAPYTRYTVALCDGTRIIGATIGDEIDWDD